MDKNKYNKIKQRILGKSQEREEPGGESLVETKERVRVSSTLGDATYHVTLYMLIGAFSICSIYAIVDIIKRFLQ